MIVQLFIVFENYWKKIGEKIFIHEAGVNFDS